MNRVRAVLFALLFFTPALTHAAPILPGAPDSVPLLYVCADGGAGQVCRDLSEFIHFVGGRKGVYEFDGVELDLAYDVTGVFAYLVLSAIYNPDPSITFTATTFNIGPGPITYGFLFGTPVVPGFYGEATSTGSVNVTNGEGGTATVTAGAVYPSYVSGHGTVGVVPTNLGVNLGTAPCVAGPGPKFAVTVTCAQGTAVNSFAPTFYDNFEVLLSYTLDDLASNAQWTTTVTLNAVPEPALLSFAGAALLGFAVRRRRATSRGLSLVHSALWPVTSRPAS